MTNDFGARASERCEWLRLPYAARDAGEAPMTWGQLTIYRPLRAMPELSGFLNFKRALALGEGKALDEALATVKALVERNQSLRARFVDDGTPRQVVAAGGECRVRVVDAGGQPVTEVLEQALAAEASGAFDFTREQPVRFVLVRADGLIRGLGLAVAHVAADAHAFELVVDQLRSLLGREPRPAAARQPLDQAGYEATPAAERRSERSLAHFRRRLAGAPIREPGTFGHDAGELPVRYFRFHSPAVVHASELLAKRTRTSASSILLTLTALVLRTRI